MSATTQVRERPVLFSGPMVRAILDGQKTQTRRVVKVLRDPPAPRYGRSFDRLDWCDWARGYCWQTEGGGCDCEVAARNPYGQPGDRLWVREAWGTVRLHEIGQHVFHDGPIPDSTRVVYRAGRRVYASEDAPEDFDFDRWPVRWRDDRKPDDGRWRPSIHMPRWASRLTLEITDVRVERVQEISIDDVLAEGIERDPDEANAGQYWREMTGQRFVELWDRINGPRGYGWNENPWCWCISFRRVDP